jgi:hypothetical protein
MKPRRLLFLGSLVLAVAIIGVFEYLNFSGYCYSECRYLSDRELIEKAVQYNLKNPPGVGGVTQYASLDEFFAMNADCCFLERGGHETLQEGTWVRLFGWYVAVADIWYRLGDVGLDAYYNSLVALNSCGQVKQRLGPLYPFPRPPSKARSKAR